MTMKINSLAKRLKTVTLLVMVLEISIANIKITENHINMNPKRRDFSVIRMQLKDQEEAEIRTS